MQNATQYSGSITESENYNDALDATDVEETLISNILALKQEKLDMLDEFVTSLVLLHDANQVELRLPGSNLTLTLEELANDFRAAYS